MTKSSFDRLLEAFLAQGITELPDRSFEAVRGEVDRRRQGAVRGPWREPSMLRVTRLVAGVAALVAATAIWVAAGHPGPAADLPGATIPASIEVPVPTQTSRPRTPGDNVLLGIGRYVMRRPGLGGGDAGWPDRVVSVELPGGWTQIGNARGSGLGRERLEIGWGAEIRMGAAHSIVRSDCAAEQIVGPGAADLAEAFSGLFEGGVSSVTVAGFDGFRLELDVPRDEDGCQVSGWATPTDEYSERWGNEWFPGSHHVLTILDVDGTRFVIDAELNPGASEELEAEMASIVESIRFDQR
jgi:hypothetical protein